MTASDRSIPEKKEISKEKINKLPVVIKKHILTFFGKIGSNDFKYSSREFKDKMGHTQYPTFQGNLLVLCSYMERAELAAIITVNFLWHIKIEETLTRVSLNKKCLPIPVLVKDPHGQLIEATPLQAVYAAGDRNPPPMSPEEKPFGLVERLASCFENPAYADKQLAAWRKNSQEATKETMAPYAAAIDHICQQMIDCKEISDDRSWRAVLALPIFLQMDAEFAAALKPNPNHIVKSGFLFSMEIFLYLIETYKIHVNNDNVEDKSRPTLGGWWSRKSDAVDVIVYPKLQARSSRYDLGIFNAGIANVAAGQHPSRLDYSAGLPSGLDGIGTTHFFGSYGKKFSREGGLTTRPGMIRVGSSARFSQLVSSKYSSNWLLSPRPSHNSLRVGVQDNVEIGISPAAKRQRR